MGPALYADQGMEVHIIDLDGQRLAASLNPTFYQSRSAPKLDPLPVLAKRDLQRNVALL